MKMEIFFEKFDQFANAPGAVAKMRELVLQLAVQGRLVNQSPDDEPADALAATISEDRAVFVKARSFARQRKIAPVEEDQQQFTLPPGWVWTRLGNLCRVQAGFAFESAAFVQGDSGVPMIRIRDITKDHTQVNFVGEFREEFLVDAGDYLVGMDGNFTVAKWRGPPALLNQRVSRLQWYSKWLEPSFFAIAAQHRLSELQGTKAYTTVDHLSSGQIENAVVPLPPLAEQKRIAAKVDELMALCDRLDAQQEKRDACNAALGRASLARFSGAPTPTNLDFVFNKSYAIPPADLRKSILTLAVQGKLVPQDPNDEPGEAIIQRIGSGTVANNGKSSPEAELGELPFALPHGWSVTRLGSVLQRTRGISYGVIKLGAEPQQGGVFILRCSNVRFRRIDLTGIRKVTEELSSEYRRTILEGGEVLINVRGTLGGCAVVPPELKGYNIAREVAVIPVHSEIDSTFLLNVIASPYFQDRVEENLRGIAYSGLNLGLLRDFLVPIPPLAEQRQIVAKVEMLMDLVDELEAQIAASGATSTNLLAALVAELTTQA